jgi:hypothetical protein
VTVLVDRWKVLVKACAAMGRYTCRETTAAMPEHLSEPISLVRPLRKASSEVAATRDAPGGAEYERYTEI